MTVALGRGLHTDYALEAVEGCCCAGHSCADVEQTARCANSTDLTAELWGGDMDAYVSDCESVFATRRVLKADDMVWQIDSLIQHARSLEHALTANLQFVFFVRHPLFNIRSLLAWCAPDGHSDADDATACAREQLRGRDRGSNNTLFLRIFAQHGTNDLFAEPVSLAATWRDVAHVYLRDPQRFAALLRYEDFVRDPAQQVTRVLLAAYGAHLAGLASRAGDAAPSDATPPANKTIFDVDTEAALAAVRQDHDLTATGSYDHDRPASELFDPATSEVICAMLAPEMDAFGYTADGVDDAFSYYSDSLREPWVANKTLGDRLWRARRRGARDRSA